MCFEPQKVGRGFVSFPCPFRDVCFLSPTFRTNVELFMKMNQRDLLLKFIIHPHTPQPLFKFLLIFFSLFWNVEEKVSFDCHAIHAIHATAFQDSEEDQIKETLSQTILSSKDEQNILTNKQTNKQTSKVPRWWNIINITKIGGPFCMFSFCISK